MMGVIAKLLWKATCGERPPPRVQGSKQAFSPGRLSIAVVDVFRDGIVIKEVRKLFFEVWTEALNQSRAWKGG